VTRIQTLVTHDGEFHLDELCASVVLRGLYPDARLLRTRDRAETGAPAPDKIMFDVGMRYDPEALCFDHHQPGAPARPEGGVYSSFGLIWKHFGYAYLEKLGVPSEWRDAIWTSIDGGMVRAIDMADNGELPVRAPGSAEDILKETAFHEVIRALHPTGEGGWDDAFDRAASICKDFLNGKILHMCRDLRRKVRVEQAIEAQWGSPILILPEPSSFDAVLHEAGADHILFVVLPRGAEWMIRGVPVSPGSFDVRLKFPESWAGLEYADLDAVSGCPGGIFCHRGRWIAIHETRDGALAMIAKALEAPEMAE